MCVPSSLTSNQGWFHRGPHQPAFPRVMNSKRATRHWNRALLIHERQPRSRRRGFFLGAPGAAKCLAECRERPPDLSVRAAQTDRRPLRQLLLDDDVAGDVVRPQRRFEHGPESRPSLACARMCGLPTLPDR